MVATRAHLNESLPATPEVIAPLRHGVADFARSAGIHGDQLDDVRLAVSEAVTNVVAHAYRDEPGEVHVTAQLVDGELWVLVADDGCGLSVPATRPGLGWGLAFITDACDEFTLAERAGGGSEARMVFRLAAGSAGEAVAGAGELESAELGSADLGTADEVAIKPDAAALTPDAVVVDPDIAIDPDSVAVDPEVLRSVTEPIVIDQDAVTVDEPAAGEAAISDEGP